MVLEWPKEGVRTAGGGELGHDKAGAALLEGLQGGGGAAQAAVAEHTGMREGGQLGQQQGEEGGDEALGDL